MQVDDPIHADVQRLAALLRRAKGFLASGTRTRGSAELVEDIHQALTELRLPRTVAEEEAQAVLDRVRAIVDAAEPGTSMRPIDCTEHCGLGPCDCSGKWRTLDWRIDVPALRAIFAEAEPKVALGSRCLRVPPMPCADPSCRDTGVCFEQRRTEPKR